MKNYTYSLKFQTWFPLQPIQLDFSLRARESLLRYTEDFSYFTSPPSTITTTFFFDPTEPRRIHLHLCLSATAHYYQQWPPSSLSRLDQKTHLLLLGISTHIPRRPSAFEGRNHRNSPAAVPFIFLSFSKFTVFKVSGEETPSERLKGFFFFCQPFPILEIMF